MKSWLTDLLRCWNWLNSWLTYWNMKKLEHDWPSDTLEMADWVAYMSKLADWLAIRLKTCWPGWPTDYWKTGWLTCWNRLTNLLTRYNWRTLTTCWLGVTDILKSCMTTGNGWLGCWLRQNWLTGRLTDWKLADSRNGWHTEKRTDWHAETG